MVKVLAKQWLIAGLVAVALLVILVIAYNGGGSDGGGVGGY